MRDKMQYIFCSLLVFITTFCALKEAQNVAHSKYFGDGYQLVWADEFSKDGQPNPKNWTYEQGFVRNEELQWYQQENAFCKNGILIIEARKTEKTNPDFVSDSKNWRKNRKTIPYTSACLITKGLKSWKYGRFEMRARIDISEGLWPAFWTLGVDGAWPANGEIDIMEYYRGKVLANIASTSKDGKTKWFSKTKAVAELGGKAWVKKFHVWRMDWDEQAISLFVDNVLFNKTLLADLDNDDRKGPHPFKQKHYILLDLAIGGMNGGDPKDTKFPNRFEIDYVRVYQK